GLDVRSTFAPGPPRRPFPWPHPAASRRFILEPVDPQPDLGHREDIDGHQDPSSHPRNCQLAVSSQIREDCNGTDLASRPCRHVALRTTVAIAAWLSLPSIMACTVSERCRAHRLGRDST